MGANDDLKAKMREALEKKKAGGSAKSQGTSSEKVHGSEVVGGSAPKMHRRKSG